MFQVGLSTKWQQIIQWHFLNWLLRKLTNLCRLVTMINTVKHFLFMVIQFLWILWHYQSMSLRTQQKNCGFPTKPYSTVVQKWNFYHNSSTHLKFQRFYLNFRIIHFFVDIWERLLKVFKIDVFCVSVYWNCKLNLGIWLVNYFNFYCLILLISQ